MAARLAPCHVVQEFGQAVAQNLAGGAGPVGYRRAVATTSTVPWKLADSVMEAVRRAFPGLPQVLIAVRR